MAWRDQLLPGSFRGAAFLVEKHDHEFGRRIDVHEFPLRDKPFGEDLGAAGRRWTVDCYVIGPDYMAGRDALVNACNAAGAGELVHPYLGRLTVMCARGRMGEDKREGGIARFQLEFVDPGDNDVPSATDDTSALADQAGQDGRDALISGFGDGFDAAALPDFAILELAALVARIALAVSSAATTVAAGVAQVTVGPSLTGAKYAVVSTLSGQLLLAGQGQVSEVSAARYALAAKASAIEAAAADLLTTPKDLATAYADLMETIPGMASDPARAFAGLMSLTGFGAAETPIPPATASRAQEALCQTALIRLTCQLAGVEAARAAAGMTFDSYDEATAVRTELCDQLDVLMTAAADAGDDGAFQALQTVRLAAAADITARGGSLARLTTIQLATPQPALVVAFRLYGDAALGDDVAARNAIPNPGFLPAEVPLEVLASA